jgi:hypothetical protein
MLGLLDRLREALTYAELRGFDLDGLEITIRHRADSLCILGFGTRF